MQIRQVRVVFRKTRMTMDEGLAFTEPEVVVRSCRDLTLEVVEVFRVFFLNSKYHLLAFENTARGTISSCLVHPREVFGTAVLLRASAIITAHNHPSGHVSPSAEDIKITRRLREAGDLLGIKLLDHVIIGSQSTCYSFRREARKEVS